MSRCYIHLCQTGVVGAVVHNSPHIVYIGLEHIACNSGGRGIPAQIEARGSRELVIDCEILRSGGWVTNLHAKGWALRTLSHNISGSHHKPIGRVRGQCRNVQL